MTADPLLRMLGLARPRGARFLNAARGRRLRTGGRHLDALAGARVLDLYAGSGALGLEAGSRGATDVHLVESDRAAATVARANAATIGAALPTTTVRVHAVPVERFLLAGPRAREPAGLVFLDPPYDLDEDRLAEVLGLLVTHPWLTTDALVVVERSFRAPEPRWPAGLALLDERRHGETRVWLAEVPLLDQPGNHLDVGGGGDSSAGHPPSG